MLTEKMYKSLSLEETNLEAYLNSSFEINSRCHFQDILKTLGFPFPDRTQLSLAVI